MRALSLLPSATDINKNCNLFGLLNKCKTAIGQRLLLQWIKQPLLDMGTALSAPPFLLRSARPPARPPLSQATHSFPLASLPFRKLSREFPPQRESLRVR